MKKNKSIYHQDQHAGSVGQHRAQEFSVLTAYMHGGKTDRERLRRNHLTGGNAKRIQRDHPVVAHTQRRSGLALDGAKQHA